MNVAKEGPVIIIIPVWRGQRKLADDRTREERRLNEHAGRRGGVWLNLSGGGVDSSLDHIFRNDKSVATATRAVDEFQRKECLDYQTTIGWLVVSEHLFLIAFNRGETTTVFEGTSEESKLIDGSSSNVRKFVQILVMVAQPRRSSTPLQLSDSALSRSSLNSNSLSILRNILLQIVSKYDFLKSLCSNTNETEGW